MLTSEAWVLYRGKGEAGPAEFKREPFSFDDLADDEVLIEPIYGCWEANLSHALARKPIDVCSQRGEEKVVLGNSGVVRVLKSGPSVIGLKPGDIFVFFGGSMLDPSGYMMLAHGYDAPRTVGLLAKQTKVRAHNLLPLPPDTRHPLKQWAAFSVRYITAWSNWKVAHGAFRLQMTEAEMPSPFVWGWGGGTTLAELDLARRFGCRATMMCSKPERSAVIEKLGIHAVDRRQFKDIELDEERIMTDSDYRSAYQKSERAFLELVRQRTDGAGVSIFLEFIGRPVFLATLKALGRQGVIATAGWKHGMTLTHNRAVACVKRHTHVHTHYARPSEAVAAIRYAEETGWMPPITDEVYAWEEVPRLARDFEAGRIDSYFPIFQINPL